MNYRNQLNETPDEGSSIVGLVIAAGAAITVAWIFCAWFVSYLQTHVKIYP